MSSAIQPLTNVLPLMKRSPKQSRRVFQTYAIKVLTEKVDGEKRIERMFRSLTDKATGVNSAGIAVAADADLHAAEFLRDTVDGLLTEPVAAQSGANSGAQVMVIVQDISKPAISQSIPVNLPVLDQR